MKRSKKNLLGALGLSVVAATTICAATLPAPGASAVSSVTDTILVRVVTDDPIVSIASELSEQVTMPDVSLDLGYANVSLVSLNVTKLNAAGGIESGPIGIWSTDANFDEGENSVAVNLDELGGYGEYIFTITGKDVKGVTHEKSLRMIYTNVRAEVDVTDDGTVCVDISDPNRTVEKVNVRAYDENDTLVGEEMVENPNGQVTLPLDGAPAGTYKVRLTYYAENGDAIGTETTYAVKSLDNETVIISVKTEISGVAKVVLYVYKDGVLKETIEAAPNAGCVNIPVDKYGPGSYNIVVEYQDEDGNIVGVPAEYEFNAPEAPHSGAPDTGGLFRNLDISRADYLATGLLVFFVFAVVAAGVVAKNRKGTKNYKKRR